MGSILIMARHISTFLPDVGDVINNAGGTTTIERNIQGDVVNEGGMTIVDVDNAEFNGAALSIQVEYAEVTPEPVLREATIITLSAAEYERRRTAVPTQIVDTTIYLITETPITT